MVYRYQLLHHFHKTYLTVREVCTICPHILHHPRFTSLVRMASVRTSLGIGHIHIRSILLSAGRRVVTIEGGTSPFLAGFVSERPGSLMTLNRRSFILATMLSYFSWSKVGLLELFLGCVTFIFPPKDQFSGERYTRGSQVTTLKKKQKQ